MIYGYAADWNDHDRVRARVYAEIERKTKRLEKHPQRRQKLYKTLRGPGPYKSSSLAIVCSGLSIKMPELSTPSILLLNRHITAEALGVLHARPLVFLVYDPLRVVGFGILLHLEYFISRKTLQTVTAAQIQSPCGSFHAVCILVTNLYSIWSQKNALTRLPICLPEVFPTRRRWCREYLCGHLRKSRDDSLSVSYMLTDAIEMSCTLYPSYYQERHRWWWHALRAIQPAGGMGMSWSRSRSRALRCNKRQEADAV